MIQLPSALPVHYIPFLIFYGYRFGCLKSCQMEGKKEFCFSELVCIERIGIHHAPTILSAHFIYNILTTLSHWFGACFNPLTTCQSKIWGDHFTVFSLFTGCLKPEWNNELDWTKDISMFGRFISPFMWPLFIYPIHKFESLYILDNES